MHMELLLGLRKSQFRTVVRVLNFEYTPNRTVYFKRVNCMVCELYFNKTARVRLGLGLAQG